MNVPFSFLTPSVPTWNNLLKEVQSKKIDFILREAAARLGYPSQRNEQRLRDIATKEPERLERVLVAMRKAITWEEMLTTK
jgi:hypothetical protein